MSDRLPKLCLHKSTGRFYITLCGREFYLGIHKPSAHRERDRLVAEWLANGRRLLAQGHDLTINELIAAYRRHAIAYYRGSDGRQTGQVALIGHSLRQLRLIYGSTMAADFGPLALQAVRQQLISQDLARSYVNDNIGRIKALFKWAVAQQLVPPSVFQGLSAVENLKRGRSAARETEPVQPISAEAFEATVRLLPKVVADMARIEWLTGCRPGELCSIRPGDVDRGKAVWCFRPLHHKNSWRGKDRRIFIGADAQAILRPYLDRDPWTFCFQPAEVVAAVRKQRQERRRTPLSCGNRPDSNRKRKPRRTPGECYTTRSYSRAIRRAAKKAGVERWSANRLRHSAAKELQAAHGIEEAAAVLGNTVPVAQRYAGFHFKLAEQTIAARACRASGSDVGPVDVD